MTPAQQLAIPLLALGFLIAFLGGMARWLHRKDTATRRTAIERQGWRYASPVYDKPHHGYCPKCRAYSPLLWRFRRMPGRIDATHERAVDCENCGVVQLT